MRFGAQVVESTLPREAGACWPHLRCIFERNGLKFYSDGRFCFGSLLALDGAHAYGFGHDANSSLDQSLIFSISLIFVRSLFSFLIELYELHGLTITCSTRWNTRRSKSHATELPGRSECSQGASAFNRIQGSQASIQA